MLDLNFKPENNVGGFCQLQFIPIQLVQDILVDDLNLLVVSSIVLKNSHKMFNLYYQRNNIELSINTDSSQNGSVLENSINGFYPKNIDSERNKINYIKDLHFIVLYQEKNGNNYVLGSLDNPCTIKFDFNNNIEQKGYEFEIKQINKDIPMLYTGVFPI